MQNIKMYQILIIYLLLFMSNTKYFIECIKYPNINNINSIIDFSSEIAHQLENNYNVDSNSNNSEADFEAAFFRIQTDFSELLLDSYKISNESVISLFNDLDHFDINSTLLGSEFHIDKIKITFYLIDHFIKLNILLNTGNNDKEHLCSFEDDYINLALIILYDDLNSLFSNIIAVIVDKLTEYSQEYYICDENISLQRNLYTFNKLLLQKHLQKFLLASYGSILKSKCEDPLSTSNSDKIIDIKNKFIVNFKECLKITKGAITNLSRSISRCDPQNHVRDETYCELERMHQIFIVDEKEINTERVCSYNCNIPEDKISYEKLSGECKKIYGCKYLTSSIETCRLHGNARRLEWFKDNDGTVYGNNTSCSGHIVNLHSVYNGDFRYCDYCICTCNGQLSQTRSVVADISFRAQISDIDNNMVVVGLRFVKKNHMIHIQIKQGKLQSEGSIDQSTVVWKPLEEFMYNDAENHHMIHFHNQTSASLIYGKDYGRPSAMNLDEIIADKNHVITGAKFKFTNDWHESSEITENTVELHIQITPFNFTDGRIFDLSKAHWISNGQLTGDQLQSADNLVPRTEVVLVAPDNPIKSPLQNGLDSEDNQFIRFSASDMKKDAGQSTVPFFDAQLVEGDPAFPLSGVELFHKGQPGYGGFLSLKIIDINLAEYINDK